MLRHSGFDGKPSNPVTFLGSGGSTKKAVQNGRSSSFFSSWEVFAAGTRYLPEWRARYLCATSRVGYMAYENWSGDAAPAIAALVAEARERGILHWRRGGEGPGLGMWKGEVELRDEGGAVLRKVSLA